MARQKQTLHGEISKSERISHPVRNKVQWFAFLNSVSLA